MDIAPVSYAQILTARDGRLVQVDNDVQNVARDLHEIDPSLRLMYNDLGEYWVVYQLVPQPDGSVDEHLVTTCLELDQRLVRRMREITHPDYDLAGELDRLDDERKAADDHEFSEYMGEQAEQIGFAMRKDLGHADHKIFVPRGF